MIEDNVQFWMFYPIWTSDLDGAMDSAAIEINVVHNF